jgi:hypothetical protein
MCLRLSTHATKVLGGKQPVRIFAGLISVFETDFIAVIHHRSKDYRYLQRLSLSPTDSFAMVEF